MNYAIFRSELIMTLNDLAQVGSYNNREKKTYNSDSDIRIELSKDNIEIVPLAEKYAKGFYNLTKDYKKEHEERIKTKEKKEKRLDNAMNDFEEKTKTVKNLIVDKNTLKLGKILLIV